LNEISNSFQVGNFHLILDIRSPNNIGVKQLNELLIPLIPYKCLTDSTIWRLQIICSASDAKGLLLGRKMPTFQKVHSSTTVTVNQDNQVLFNTTSEDLRILSPERILFSVMFLATWWHVIHGGLCLHAAGVSYKNKGFLFLGESGAGKSTVSALSDSIGIPVLAEDRVFVLRDETESYALGAGPHEATTYHRYVNMRAKLAAAYILVQDRENSVRNLPKKDAAKYIYAAFLQNSASGYLPKDVLKLAFKVACDLARNLQIFELHFNKSPDFWKLIDAQFAK